MFDTIRICLVTTFLALPVFSAIRLIVNKKSSFGSWVKWTLISSFACYFLILVTARMSDAHLKSKLDSYDLDGNGMFSGTELTPDMDQAMSDFTTDTGRTLAPITGLIISPVYCGFWHVLIGLPYILVKRNPRFKTQPTTGPRVDF